MRGIIYALATIGLATLVGDTIDYLKKIKSKKQEKIYVNLDGEVESN